MEASAGRTMTVSIMNVTDLHCCESRYKWIEGMIVQKSQAVNKLLFSINGDFVTKILHNPNGIGWFVEGAKLGDTHGDRIRLFENFLRKILLLQNVIIVINLGNHEFMHPDEVAFLLRNMLTAFPGRIYVITNVELTGPFAGLAQPFVKLWDAVACVGYCTVDIFEDDPQKNAHYGYARQKGFYICPTGGIRRNCQDYNTKLQAILRRINAPLVVFLAHEGRQKMARYVWPIVIRGLPSCVKQKILVLGHDHFDFRPNKESTRPFGIFNRQGNKVSIPESNNQGAPIDVSFQEVDRVIAPKPFGRSIEYVDMEIEIQAGRQAPQQYPQAPEYPREQQYPQAPQYPWEQQYPQAPQYPWEQQYPQAPQQYPQEQQYPQAPQYPWEQQYPQVPQYPQAPQYPQVPQYPWEQQYPQAPQYPWEQQYPQAPQQYPQAPEDLNFE
jgi:hypothetical protein